MLFIEISKIRDWRRLALKIFMPISSTLIKVCHNIFFSIFSNFWSCEWHKYDNEKVHVIYSLLGLNNHNLGSSLPNPWVIFFCFTFNLSTFLTIDIYFFFSVLTPENINRFVRSLMQWINSRDSSLKIRLFLFNITIVVIAVVIIIIWLSSTLF